MSASSASPSDPAGEFAMRSNSMMPRLVVGLTLCGLLLIASCIGGSNPVAAMGGFGRMGGFGGRAMGFGGGPRQHMTAPRRGAGRVVGRPSGGRTGNTGRDGGRGSRHYPIAGPGIGGGPDSDIPDQQSVRSSGNSGRSGVPPHGERRFVPDEVITAFAPNATPQVDQSDRAAVQFDTTRGTKPAVDRHHAVSLARWKPPFGGGRRRRARG